MEQWIKEFEAEWLHLEQQRLIEEAEAMWFRLEQQRSIKEDEAEWLRLGEIEIDEDHDTPLAVTQDNKDEIKPSLRISTNFKRHPRNLDLTVAKAVPSDSNINTLAYFVTRKRQHFALCDPPKVIVTAYQKVLANALMISDFNAITYPEGVLGPSPALNENSRDGKFQ